MTGKLIHSRGSIQLACSLDSRQNGEEKDLARTVGPVSREGNVGLLRDCVEEFWKKIAGDTPKTLESRTVGKSHEWPRNVNEAPVTQFCSAPLHPPVFPPLAALTGGRVRASKRKREREGGREIGRESQRE